MVDVEAVVTLVLCSGVIGYFWRRQSNMDERLHNTYSKAETDQQILLRMEPMQNAVLENTKAVMALTETLVDLRISMGEVQSDVRHIKEEQGSEKT